MPLVLDTSVVMRHLSLLDATLPRSAPGILWRFAAEKILWVFRRGVVNANYQVEPVTNAGVETSHEKPEY